MKFYTDIHEFTPVSIIQLLLGNSRYTDFHNGFMYMKQLATSFVSKIGLYYAENVMLQNIQSTLLSHQVSDASWELPQIYSPPTNLRIKTKV